MSPITKTKVKSQKRDSLPMQGTILPCYILRTYIEGLTLSQSQDIERIQKRALRIITPNLKL